MRQNNNQEQKSYCGDSKSNFIHDNSVSKKVLELDYQFQSIQKYYLTAKKPIKYFAKVKRSVKQSKNSERNTQTGILSQKLIPQNLGANLQCSEKPNYIMNVKVKNVFQAYKQALQHKYRRKMKEMENNPLKIDTGKAFTNQQSSNTCKMISQKEHQIMNKFNSKNLEITLEKNTENHQKHATMTNTRASSHLKNNNNFKSSNSYRDTIDSDCHNFIRAGNKKKINKLNDFANQKIQMYQIKRKCHTEETQGLQQAEFNKTKNITFRLPVKRTTESKTLIERIGGNMHNLPLISQKIQPKPTISYRVKSLKNNSLIDCSNFNENNEKHNTSAFVSGKNVRQYNLTKKIKQNRHRTLPVEQQKTLSPQHHNQSVFTQSIIFDSKYTQQNYPKQRKRNKTKLLDGNNRRKHNRKQLKNQTQDIEAWRFHNQNNEEECTFYPFQYVNQNQNNKYSLNFDQEQ